MMTAFMNKWRELQITKLKKEIENLVEENVLAQQDGTFVYKGRETEQYVVLEKKENGFLCTLMDKKTALVSYQILAKHALFDKVNQEYTIWEQIDGENTNGQLQGLSKNRQVKYQKLIAGSIR